MTLSSLSTNCSYPGMSWTKGIFVSDQLSNQKEVLSPFPTFTPRPFTNSSQTLQILRQVQDATLPFLTEGMKLDLPWYLFLRTRTQSASGLLRRFQHNFMMKALLCFTRSLMPNPPTRLSEVTTSQEMRWSLRSPSLSPQRKLLLCRSMSCRRRLEVTWFACDRMEDRITQT